MKQQAAIINKNTMALRRIINPLTINVPIVYKPVS